MCQSIWKQTRLPEFSRLCGEEHTDVLIIGGGLCGVLCAHYLTQAGIDCILLEAGRIGQGTSGNSTGKITWLHGLRYADLMRKKGAPTAKMYLDAGRQALIEYQKLAQRFDFDFETAPAYTYSLHNREAIEAEAIALRALGERAEFSPCNELPFKTVGGIRVEGQGQMNVMKLLSSLVDGIEIFENSRVLKVTPYGVFTERGMVRAQRIIACTHFPFIDRYGGYFLKQYQHREYLLALKGAPKMRGMYVDEASRGLTFRSYGEYLLMGGGAHRTGKQGGGMAEVTAAAKRFFPKAEIVARWAAQDCMTLDGLAYIGQYSEHTPNLFVATGFNKWGLSGAMTAAMILRDKILGKERPYAPLFAPSRSIWHPQLFVNAFESITNFLMPLPRRCTHLGCALHYNRAEHSWDCACHGSRFDETGKILNNPANREKN